MSKIVRNIPDGLEASYADIKLDTISDLVNLTGTPPEIVWVSGYHTKGDGSYGSHIFEWDPNSTEPHNGGTIIELGAPFPTVWSDQTQLDAWFNYSGGTTGRYKLRYDDSVNVKWFGAKGDGTDDTVALYKCSLVAKSGTIIDFEEGKTYKIDRNDGINLDSVYGYIVMKFGDLDGIKLNGNNCNILLDNYDISIDGYGMSFCHFNDCGNVEVSGFNVDMSFKGVNNSSSKYPLCSAFQTNFVSKAVRNINISKNTFKMFHPYGQYCSTDNPYNGDSNNGFKILPIFVQGDHTQTDSSLLTRDIYIDKNHFIDGHNGYCIWVWSCSDVKITNNSAINWSGKKSHYDGTTFTQEYGSIPMIRYIQFYADNVEISGNILKGRPQSMQSTGYEGNSNFITLATNLSHASYNALINIHNNHCKIEGDVNGLSGELAALSIDTAGKFIISNNTVDIVSQCGSYPIYGIVDNFSADRDDRDIQISNNIISSDIITDASIYIANASPSGNNANLIISDNKISGFETGFIIGGAEGGVYGVNLLNATGNIVETNVAFNINNSKNTNDIYVINNNIATNILANKTWILSNKIYIADNTYSSLGNAVTEETSISDTRVYKSINGTSRLRAESSGGGSIELYAQDGNQYIISTGACSFLPSVPNVFPNADNSVTLGKASNRWSSIYAGDGTINTSDDREKTYIDITDIEKQVALELKNNMKKFKFNDSIAKKGDNARIHFGASAQTVKSIFEKHGLIAEDYSILCYDEWEEQKDEDGNIIAESGNRYGLRYEELLCFIMSAI